MPPDPTQVTLAEGQTGSTLLHGALASAIEVFPAVFDGIAVPSDGGTFKQELPDLIVRFEARRLASPQRIEIARRLAAYVPDRARWGEVPLPDALTGPDLASPEGIVGEAAPGWIPTLRYRDRDYAGSEIAALAERLRGDRQLTQAAADALGWMARERLSAPLVLTDHRFALLGAGAELAPTPYLLAAGARVVWVDPQPPPDMDPSGFAGTLVRYPGADDLLCDTPRIHSAVARECESGPLHLGLYAYAPGKGREIRLTSAMNAIAAATDPASVAMLVSPTTPGQVQPEDGVDRVNRRAEAPRWQRALARTALLGGSAHHTDGDIEVSRSIVPLQGPTYLAAQYLSKMMLAEAWAIDRAPLRVSANVAGITHTKSLEHPLFLAGFAGAPAFGIEIFQPETTRILTTLLMLHDVLNPDAPGADASGGPLTQVDRLTAQSIHGGVRSAPFGLDPTIRVAAVLGLTRRPGLLLQLRR